jgi:DNA-binding transcriptional ArsR family regulator
MAASKRSLRTPEEALLFVLRHPLRKRLLRFYVEAEGTLSPKQLTLLANEPEISVVGYHVRVLAENGAVELVKTVPRRGSVEHFYKATNLVDEVAWDAQHSAWRRFRHGRQRRTKVMSVRLSLD